MTKRDAERRLLLEALAAADGLQDAATEVCVAERRRQPKPQREAAWRAMDEAMDRYRGARMRVGRELHHAT